MSPHSRPGTATRPEPGLATPRTARGLRGASHRNGSRGPRGAIAAVAVLVLGFLLAGCGGASFDPAGPCTADGSAPGAYPELEAVIPKTHLGAAPSQLDSGRACTTAGLATLAGHGVKELRFAGGTWSTGSESGVSLAVFTVTDGPALEPAWLAEFYEAGARGGKNVTSVDASDYDVRPGVTGRRIDVLNGESYQSVIVWEKGGQVVVALVADAIREIQTKEAHDKVVRSAVDTYAG